MRVLIGIIFGVLLTVGGAYLYRLHTTPWLIPAPRAACNAPWSTGMWLAPNGTTSLSGLVRNGAGLPPRPDTSPSVD